MQFHMAAELLPHRREHFLGERVFLPRAETDVKRGSENVCRNGFFNRGHDRPAAFARILHVACIALERGVLRQRNSAEIEQELTTLPRRQSSEISPRSRLY